MKIKQLLFLTVLSLSLSAHPAVAYSFEGGNGPNEEMMKAHHDEMVKDLDLTEDQKKRMKEYKSKHFAQMKELRETLKGYRQELKKELSKYDSNPAEVERISNNIKNIHSRLVDHRIETIQTMKTILTPEQFEKFQEKAEVMRGKFKEKWKNKKSRSKKGSMGGFPEGKE